MSITILLFLSYPSVRVFKGIKHAFGQKFVVFHLSVLQLNEITTNAFILITKVVNRQLVFFQQLIKAFANANKLLFGLLSQCPNGLYVAAKQLFVGH